MNIRCGFSKLRMMALALCTIFLTQGLASAAFNSVTDNALLRLTNGHGTTAGGEFDVYAAGAAVNPAQANGTLMFSTFCCEKNQNITLSTGATAGRIFKVASSVGGRTGIDTASDQFRPILSQAVVLGMTGIDASVPINATPASTLNILTYGTSVLYKGFAEGLRTGAAVATFTNFGGLTYQLATTNAVLLAQRVSDANDMQNAVWYFQRQQTQSVAISGLTGNKYIDAVKTYLAAFVGTDAAKLASLDISGVEIMNLRNTSPNGTADVQSQLHYTYSPPSTDVPEPASMALWLTVAVGGLFLRRRRSITC